MLPNHALFRAQPSDSAGGSRARAQPLKLIPGGFRRAGFREAQRGRVQSASLADADRGQAPWTRAELEQAIAARAEGMTLPAIAEMLSRTYFAVRWQLRQERRRRMQMQGSATGRLNLADRLDQRKFSYARLATATGAGRSTLHRLAATGAWPSRGQASLKTRIEAVCLEKKLADAEELFWLWRPAAKTIARRKEMHNRILLSAEALDRFRLSRDPFGLEPRSLEEVFRSRDANRLLKLLEDTVRYQGWVALAAEIGAGKTTLVRTFLETMRKDKAVRFWRPAFADPAKLTARNICEDIVRAHDQVPAASHTQLYRQVEKILAEEGRLDHRVCLVIDEAHRLPARTLSALKNLYELRDDERPLSRLLGIILIGQPPLRDRLEKNYDFREVAERIRVVGLPDFNASVAAYLDHRLKNAGGSLEKLFEPAAVAQIRKLGRTPQEAGNIAAAAMEGAAGAGLAKVSASWVASVTSMEVAELRVVESRQPAGAPERFGGGA